MRGASPAKPGCPMKVVLAPGNGAGNVKKCLWYGDLERRMQQMNIPVTVCNYPDPIVAHKSVWLPFMRDELHCDEHTIVVGHSSGAVAGLRLAESGVRLGGLVLVSAYHTDLGDEGERASGYFDDEWRWPDIVANCGFIAQYHGSDDPLVDIQEGRHVHEMTNSEYYELDDVGHFQVYFFPELYALLKERIWGSSSRKHHE
ncbi:serine hydrolase RBBP9 [Pelomyxa schiedti]|nr:serine hydrolase RBBP9 [Pelomyxa schiedti]